MNFGSLRKYLFAILLWFAAPAWSADVKDLEPLLKHEVVGQAVLQGQMQEYCDSKVPRMGKYASAEAWQTEADRLRSTVLEHVVFRGKAKAWRDAPSKVEWLETTPGGPGYSIKKLRYEAVPGFWIPAVIYLPDHLAAKVPVVMVVNGHSGPVGKIELSKQVICANLAQRGMISMNVEWIGMGQLNSLGYAHTRMNQLDLCGSSGIAPFFCSMKHGLDVLLGLENADPKRVAVTGLSGGGWQTIFISSLDPRVTLATPVAGYSSFRTRAYHFKDLGDTEQTPCDLATIADYTHLTAMLAPRAALLVFNSKDNCCFESGYALEPLLAAALPIYKLYGKQDFLRSHVNDDPGTHNYEIDNRQAFYHAVGDYFFAGDKSFSPTEIPLIKAEVKNAEQLHVDLPENNANFNTLALAQAKDLPLNAEWPADKAAIVAWQKKVQTSLEAVVRAKSYKAEATACGSESKSGITANYWRFDLNGIWTVPGLELVGNAPTKTAILVNETGRAASSEFAAPLLAKGYRVIAIDPLSIGESSLKQSWLFELLIASVGDRALGIQASQIAAVSRWAAEKYKSPVTLVTVGRRCGVSGLLAAVLAPDSIAGVEENHYDSSLKQLLERNDPYNGSARELYCYGLLEQADIRQMAAAIAPHPVKFNNPDARAKSEFGALKGLYHALGSDFDPLQP